MGWILELVGHRQRLLLATLAIASLALADLLWEAICTLASSAVSSVEAGGTATGRLALQIQAFVLFFGLFFVYIVGVHGRRKMLAASPPHVLKVVEPPGAGKARLENSCSLALSMCVIHIAAARGDVSVAEREFNLILQKGTQPDIIMYNSVINACTKAKDATRAQAWIRRMIGAGVEPDVLSYTTVIESLGKQGTKEGAEQAVFWFDHMLAAGVRPDQHAFSAIIRACSKTGDLSGCERLLNMMDALGLAGNTNIFNQMLSVCSRMGDSHALGQMFRRMRHAKVKPNIVSYTTAARGLASNGDYTAVEKLQLDMESDAISPSKYFSHLLQSSYRFCPEQRPGPSHTRDPWTIFGSRAGPLSKGSPDHPVNCSRNHAVRREACDLQGIGGILRQAL